MFNTFLSVQVSVLYGKNVVGFPSGQKRRYRVHIYFCLICEAFQMFNTFLSVYSSIDVARRRYGGAHPSNRDDDDNNNSLPYSRFVLFVLVLVADVVAFAFVVHVHRLRDFKLFLIA